MVIDVKSEALKVVKNIIVDDTVQSGRQVIISTTLPPLLGAFAKWRKATISFVISICSHGICLPGGQIFIKFDIWGIFFENPSRKFKFHLSWAGIA
jgi:hypothetical protein